ncbi:TM1266 family iron-only hydrogenase system putative regulator [Sporohalobacter salinus]|uniref:TM1266 family iron-only hydrogenase system putative regulator n=1 Tax=Sporohalobacter salinus TaxID=1494606 RepID=UPI0019607740|nr:TM1266 family iron-only hydrogenase system putative regulator [Sporohalobacter salinus]MBM7624944.1 putative iron-only hydrogenase system regulator [Sporohalobacter salinus]
MEDRIAVVGILIEERKGIANKVNEVLGEFGDIIVGRMGIPYREKEVSVISLIVNGTTDQLGAMSGQLGNLEGVKVKSAVTA